ncbi:MAG: RNA polymerase sigma factor [Clostridia bacterium]|nr:RNA polymerase sigma factor [Clostridia bacterium]
MLSVFTSAEIKTRQRDAWVEKLILRMSVGEISAMGDLYELIGTDVYAFALSKMANREDAEDITHDTFVQIWKSARQYSPMGKPLAWIFTIEINLIRKQRNRTQKSIPFDEAIETELDGEDFTENMISDDFFRQMLKCLNEEEREIISLHIVSGLKHREISKLLDKPLSTVLSKYSRAIKKLQKYAKEREESR